VSSAFTETEINTALSIFNTLPDYVCWKDTELNYTLMNEATATLFGFRSSAASFNLISDHDLHCDAVALADQFQRDDRYVLTSGNDLTLINFCKYENDQWRLLFGRKSLLTDATGTKKGIYGRFMDVTNSPIFKIIFGFCSQDKKAFNQVSYVIKDRFDEFNFSTRESEIMFYLVRGHTAKEIGRKIHLSYRTIEKHIDHMKKKLDVYSKSQLIDKALSLGMMSYLPSSLTDEY